MAEAVESGGAQAVIDYIEAFDSDALRRVLYVAVRKALAPPGPRDKRLDELIAVSDAGIVEMLRQAEAAIDDDTRWECIRGAHTVSYNLAAELADWWPGDDTPRSRAHHLRGAQAAVDCLVWSEAGSEALPISTDYLVRGVHQLALGDVPAAIRSWRLALEHATEAVEGDNRATETDAQSEFAVNLSSGYLGLARWISGDEAGGADYEAALAAFRAQLKDPETAEDGNLGIGQLEKTRRKYGP